MRVEYLVSQLNLGRTLVFDLDNTIFDERDFLFSAYETIAKMSSGENADLIWQYLCDEFQKAGRFKLFDKLFSVFPDIGLELDDCLKVLRCHTSTKSIQPYDWIKEFLIQVPQDFNLRIITNGNVEQQKAKMANIQFPAKLNNIEVVYANEFLPKPAPDSFFKLKGWHDFCEPIFVGDSEVDRLFCDNLNIQFVNANQFKVNT